MGRLIFALQRACRWLKRQMLIGEIVSLQERMAIIEQDGLDKYDKESVIELRCMIALARARLASDEFARKEMA